MIDDPILLKNHPDIEFFQDHRSRGKEDCFYRMQTGNSTVIALIDIGKSDVVNYWFRFVTVQSNSGNYGLYVINGTAFGMDSITREKFIGGMIEKYPDHFEWLLFHPEHLK